MNCKKGDLARVINKEFPEYGWIVVCVNYSIDYLGNEGWITNPSPLPQNGKMYLGFLDKHLDPIRPSDGEDEMLRIAGLPNKELVSA